MSNDGDMTPLIGDAAAAVAAAPKGFTRGVIVLETKDGNFLTITRGDDLESAADAVCEAMANTQVSDEDEEELSNRAREDGEHGDEEE